MTATSDGCATSTRLVAAGKTAIAEATKLWQRDVYDPARNDYTVRGVLSRVAINEILRASGWTWIDYRGDGDVEWCGLFVGACWKAAGIDPKWLATYFASTYRLDAWARYRDFNPRHPNPRPATGPWRLIAELGRESTSIPFEPMAGDILMIGDGQPAFGDHICLVESYADGVFSTIEGNGNGRAPNGKIWQGVVRGKRKLGGDGWHARRLIRPAPSDLG